MCSIIGERKKRGRGLGAREENTGTDRRSSLTQEGRTVIITRLIFKKERGSVHHEKDISAELTKKKKNTWVPRTDGDT